MKLKSYFYQFKFLKKMFRKNLQICKEFNFFYFFYNYYYERNFRKYFFQIKNKIINLYEKTKKTVSSNEMMMKIYSFFQYFSDIQINLQNHYPNISFFTVYGIQVLSIVYFKGFYQKY
ncbi:hypothetical protein IMG5_097030 [Ichthyophthirius multifiliis]|uniref:Transmembrane protein n=1 Tax=Ichthyophthirius multifiliis TaxID=5932 RepID=G0QRS0_ICHMU|nr:hypothetical protein IMG5_097030 [Ichthyophthirius multifiliis]EGR32089.1 hypothetical protein IMG5_097030 [Ichthyophthirius multifiliis]|eukprot:XP_004035575.1 hypothetical protein IMG5_097030 [Ichthyophthirius multifiliis]